MTQDQDLILANPEAERLTLDVEGVTARLDRVMGELDRRRHHAFDTMHLTDRLRRHAWTIFGAAALAGGGVAVALIVRQRTKRTPARRVAAAWKTTWKTVRKTARKTARAKWSDVVPVRITFGAADKEPPGAKPSSLLVKVAFAFASGAAGVLGRRLTEAWAGQRRL